MKKTKMLKKNYEFKRVLSKGEFYRQKHLEAFILENKGNSNFLGLAISTKIAKSAKRNLIKRLIREAYKEYEDNIKEGVSIVFLWNKKAEVKNAEFSSIKRDMYNIFDKAKILKKDECL